MTSAVNSPLSR